MKNKFSSLLKIALFITLFLLLSGILISCSYAIQDDWNNIVIGNNLPTPSKGKLQSGSNLDNGFFGGIEKVNAEYYKEYKTACINFGYTIESKETGYRYEAFNDEGYKLSLYFNNNKINITLEAPEKLVDFKWPTSGIGALLPMTTSAMGKITSDSSDCFRITVGNTTLEEYNKYVEACEGKGFTIDYYKQDGKYEAKNSDGYRLNLSYEGCNRIDVMIQAPKSESPKTPTEIETQLEEKATDKIANEEISQEFKKAMDDYEGFFHEYVSFMKKYKESNGTDFSLLTEYATYLTKYSEMIGAFEEWESKDLNAAELAYYIQVQNRIAEKLLEIAQ